MDDTRGTLLEIKRAAERKTNNASWDAPTYDEVYRPTTEGEMSDTMDIVHSIFARMGEIVSKMRAKFTDDLSLGEMRGEIGERDRQRQMANMQAISQYRHAQIMDVGNLGASGLGGYGNALQGWHNQLANQAAMQNVFSNQALYGLGGIQPLAAAQQQFPVYHWPQQQAPIAVPSAPNEPTGAPVGLMEEEVMKEWERRKAKT